MPLYVRDSYFFMLMEEFYERVIIEEFLVERPTTLVKGVHPCIDKDYIMYSSSSCKN